MTDIEIMGETEKKNAYTRKKDRKNDSENKRKSERKRETATETEKDAVVGGDEGRGGRGIFSIDRSETETERVRDR